MSDKDIPAFPTDSHESPFVKSSSGMTLRDYFAATALQGMLAHSTRYRPRDRYQHWHDAISQEAYEIADSMLQERRK